MLARFYYAKRHLLPESQEGAAEYLPSRTFHLCFTLVAFIEFSFLKSFL
jgi:hypothetical protein